MTIIIRERKLSWVSSFDGFQILVLLYFFSYNLIVLVPASSNNRKLELAAS